MRKCPENKYGDSVFVKDSDWQEHHRRRRQDAINAMVSNIRPGKIREIFLNRIKKELDDLGILVNSEESTTVERIRDLAGISDRTCPMCLVRFDNGESSFVFEFHVDSHFSN